MLFQLSQVAAIKTREACWFDLIGETLDWLAVVVGDCTGGLELDAICH